MADSRSIEKELPASLPNPALVHTRWLRLAECFLALAALLPLVLFLITAICRLHYPFLLEQLEGPMLLAAERVARGLPVYTRPDFHFIPYMYAPAYYYVSGWAVRLLGPGFFPLRLVSLLSTLGAFGVIYTLVLLDTHGSRARRHLAALAAAGMYAAMYPWTRNWFDLARLDSLYIFLLLLALLCTRKLHPVAAALAWTLVFLSKQTIFPVAVILLCHDWKRPRRLLLGLSSFLIFAVFSVWSMDQATNGWYRFYAFMVPHANADLRVRELVFYWPSEILAPIGAVLLLIGVAWACTRPGLQSSATRLYLLAGIATLGLCWFLQAHAGATANTPMPTYAVLAVLFGLALGRLDAWLSLNSGNQVLRIGLLALAAIPLLSWVYWPHDVIPQPDLRASQEETVAWLRGFSGDVFVPSDPYLAVLAGKSSRPDVAALHDALRPGLAGVNPPVIEAIRQEIDREKFDVIAFNGSPSDALREQTWLPRDLLQHYPVVGLVPGSGVGDRFAPRPSIFLIPCREEALAIQKGWSLVRNGASPVCPASKPLPAAAELQRR